MWLCLDRLQSRRFQSRSLACDMNNSMNYSLSRPEHHRRAGETAAGSLYVILPHGHVVLDLLQRLHVSSGGALICFLLQLLSVTFSLILLIHTEQ